MEVHLSLANFHENLRTLAESLQGSYHLNNGQSICNFSGRMGNGRIKGVSFHECMNALILEADFKYPLLISYRTDCTHPLKLIYCFEGDMIHCVSNHDVEYQLHSRYSTLSSGTDDDLHKYLFQPGKQKLAIIEVDRSNCLHNMNIKAEELPDSIKPIFSTQPDPKAFYYRFKNPLALEELFSTLFDLDLENILNRLHFQGKIFEIVAFMLKMAQRQGVNGDEEKYDSYDIKRLTSAKKILLENLKNPPTIKGLAHQVAINQTKLKRGFKELFGDSPYQYVLKERINKATEMMSSNPEIKISEVAEKVGYANKSQFTYQFRKYMGVLPRKYRKQCQEN